MSVKINNESLFVRKKTVAVGLEAVSSTGNTAYICHACLTMYCGRKNMYHSLSKNISHIKSLAVDYNGYMCSLKPMIYPVTRKHTVINDLPMVILDTLHYSKSSNKSPVGVGRLLQR